MWVQLQPEAHNFYLCSETADAKDNQVCFRLMIGLFPYYEAATIENLWLKDFPFPMILPVYTLLNSISWSYD